MNDIFFSSSVSWSRISFFVSDIISFSFFPLLLLLRRKKERKIKETINIFHCITSPRSNLHDGILDRAKLRLSRPSEAQRIRTRQRNESERKERHILFHCAIHSGSKFTQRPLKIARNRLLNSSDSPRHNTDQGWSSEKRLYYFFIYFSTAFLIPGSIAY